MCFDCDIICCNGVVWFYSVKLEIYPLRRVKRALIDMRGEVGTDEIFAGGKVEMEMLER